MILTITLNPCIDESSRVDQLIPENKLRCSEVRSEEHTSELQSH